MPTYEYRCVACGHVFEQQQSITEAPVAECPKCRGKVHRIISGGTGFILKEGTRSQHENGCSLEMEARTCCGRDERCEKPPCGDLQ